jgi:hypothetical protein
MDQIEEALAALRMSDNPNISAIARNHKVDPSTLNRRWRGITSSREDGYDAQRFLTPGENLALLEHIHNLTECGLPPTCSMVHNIATEIKGRAPGKNWVSRWLNQNTSSLGSRYLQALDIERKRADSVQYYRAYFGMMERKIKQYNVLPENVYNMDEKGFLIGYLKKSRRVYSKSAWEGGKVGQVMQDGNREWITIVATICGDGTALPPCLIYQGKTGNIQEAWLEDFDSTIHNAQFNSSPSGWTSDEIGRAWLEVFEKQTKEKARIGREWRLLIVDGHGSHVNMAFINFCDAHRILLAIFPPHSTHRLQPLDVCLFSPLSTYYSQELNLFTMKHFGEMRFTKRHFFLVFWTAWNKAFTPKNIASGWKKTGLYPHDPEIVLALIKTTKDRNPIISEVQAELGLSSPSVTIRKAWIDGIGPNPTREQREAFKIVMRVFTTNKLLEHEVKDRQATLKLEKAKKKKKRGMFQGVEELDNGGGQFWSPGKIDIARDYHAQKDEEERVEIARKAGNKAAATLKKVEKEQLDKVKADKKLQDQIERAFQDEKKKEATAERLRLRKEAAARKKEEAQHQQQLRGEVKALQIYTAPKKGPKKAQKANAIMEEVVEVLGPNSPGRRLRSKPFWTDGCDLS